MLHVSELLAFFIPPSEHVLLEWREEKSSITCNRWDVIRILGLAVAFRDADSAVLHCTVPAPFAYPEVYE